MPYVHNHNRAPYIAVQVNEFGITHISFNSEAGRVKWISPNKADKQTDFFQDRGSTDCYNSHYYIRYKTTTLFYQNKLLTSSRDWSFAQQMSHTSINIPDCGLYCLLRSQHVAGRQHHITHFMFDLTSLKNLHHVEYTCGCHYNQEYQDSDCPIRRNQDSGNLRSTLTSYKRMQSFLHCHLHQWSIYMEVKYLHKKLNL